MLIRDEEIIKAECVAAETRKDKILHHVLKYTRDGWCNNPEECLLPYYRKRFEISIENDILLWGDRVIVPESLRNILLNDLHGEHMGIVKTKQLARKYIWWPHLDAEIEETTKSCVKLSRNHEESHFEQQSSLVLSFRSMEKTRYGFCRT